MRLCHGVLQRLCQQAKAQRGWGFGRYAGGFVSQELQFL